MSVHFSSKSVEWYTPPDLFQRLTHPHKVTLDVCAKDRAASKCDKFFTPEQDGLKQDWSNDICWMNPPYGREIGKWVEKAAQNSVIALLPARTDTRWFHEYIYDQDCTTVYFLKGRVKFVDEYGRPQHPAPFPSMAVYFNLHPFNLYP